MGAVGAEEEFELEPDGMFRAEQLAVIVVVLQAQLGEFAGIKGQVRGYTRSFTPEHVVWIVNAIIAIGVFSAEPGHPTLSEAP